MELYKKKKKATVAKRVAIKYERVSSIDILTNALKCLPPLAIPAVQGLWEERH